MPAIKGKLSPKNTARPDGRESTGARHLPFRKRYRHIMTEHMGLGKIVHAHETGHEGAPDRFKIILIHSGKIRFFFDEIPFEAGKGDVVFIKPGSREFFHFYGEPRIVHSYCVIRKRHMLPDLIARLAPLHAPRKLPSTPHFERIMQSVLSSPVSLTEAGITATERLAHCLFYEFLRMEESATDTARKISPHISKIVSHLHEFMAEPLELKTIGEELGISPHHIIRLFREHLHETPMRYLWNLRVKRGADLLKHTGLSISEVAYQVGFRSQFHFSRTIKKEFGMSPREFRKAARESSESGERN